MPDLTYQDVLSILRLIDAGSFSNLEIEFEGTRLKVSRLATGAVSPPGGGARTPRKPSPAVSPKNAVPVAPSPSGGAKPEQEPSADIPNGVAVKPPMEGTFYAAASPGAPAFAEIGKRVRKGDQLGIVEVMKLFTPVSSPCDGTIRSIQVRNEQVVSAGQTLMVIEEDL
ncbi:MAG: biotin/lipoyl-binding protein [Burkholderiaceae bacterium]|nr:biotin/lipoyl-binding protein [Burkholderiaceae bacterium]